MLKRSALVRPARTAAGKPWRRPTAQRDFYDYLMSRNVAQVIDKAAIDAAMLFRHSAWNAARLAGSPRPR